MVQDLSYVPTDGEVKIQVEGDVSGLQGRSFWGNGEVECEPVDLTTAE